MLDHGGEEHPTTYEEYRLIGVCPYDWTRRCETNSSMRTISHIVQLTCGQQALVSAPKGPDSQRGTPPNRETRKEQTPELGTHGRLGEPRFATWDPWASLSARQNRGALEILNNSPYRAIAAKIGILEGSTEELN